MTFALRVGPFAGEQPRVNPRLLPAAAAQYAENISFTTGGLNPVFTPIQVAPVGVNTQSIYRMFLNTADYWLSWDTDVDVAKTATAGDMGQRIGFTSAAFEPRMTDLPHATATYPYPAQWFVLGVAPPEASPTVATAGGAGVASEDRYYVYTFVTPMGEESAPSPPSGVTTGYSNGVWTVSGMSTAPPNSGVVSFATAIGGAGTVEVTLDSTVGLRAGELISFTGVMGMTSINSEFRILSVDKGLNRITIPHVPSQTYQSGGVWARSAPHNTTGMTRRIYRTATGSNATSFLFVAEVPVGTGGYVDGVPGTLLGEPCPSVNWLMPPASLQGIQTLPNGAAVAFSGNDLCFSEPYRPFAWPIANQLTTDFPIVGLGVFGQSVAVCTTGSPYIATGVDPAAVTLERVPEPWPCVSKRGVVSLNGAVYFPTPMGLATLGMQGTGLVSESLFAQRDWVGVNPSSFTAAHYDGQYYAAHTGAGAIKVLTLVPSKGVTRFGFTPDAMYTDASNGKLYGAMGGGVYEMFPTSGGREQMAWTS
jgi:hypothetical protein